MMMEHSKLKEGQTDSLAIDHISALLSMVSENGQFDGVARQVVRGLTYKDILKEMKSLGQYCTPNFSVDIDNTLAYENLAKWLIGDNTMVCINPDTMKIVRGDIRKGIYLYGPIGAGKTMIMEILSAIARFHNYSFKSNGGEYPLAWDNVRADHIASVFSEEGYIPYLRDRIVCIHDLGVEPKESIYMGNRVNVLRKIIESRGDWNRTITLITSNLSLQGGNRQALTDRYGDRAVSRLVGRCNYLILTGGDRRKL